MSQKYIGEVVGLKSAKTATVKLVSIEIHPKYHKPQKIVTTKKVHYEEAEFPLRLGDKVEIKNSGRKYSKTKSFLVIKKVENQ